MKISQQHMRVSVTSEGESVHTLIRQPLEGDSKRMVVVFSHGFSVDGTESGRQFVDLSNKLLEQGYSCVLFDYRGSGYSDMAFENMTFDTELVDLAAILGFTRQQFPEYKIAVWGESFGCAVAAHTASQRNDVALLVLWSLSADLYRRYQKRLGRNLERNGYVYTPDGFKVKREFLESLRNRDTYTAIRETRIPCLLVHGTADHVADVGLSRTAHKLAPRNTTLREIRGGNHGFAGQPQQFGEACAASLEWLRTHSETHA